MLEDAITWSRMQVSTGTTTRIGTAGKNRQVASKGGGATHCRTMRYYAAAEAARAQTADLHSAGLQNARESSPALLCIVKVTMRSGALTVACRAVSAGHKTAECGPMHRTASDLGSLQARRSTSYESSFAAVLQTTEGVLPGRRAEPTHASHAGMDRSSCLRSNTDPCAVPSWFKSTFGMCRQGKSAC